MSLGKQATGIRARLWLAAGLPAVLAVATLLVGFLERHNTEMTAALTDRARAAAAQLGGAAEFALFAGHQEGLQRLVDAALAGDAQMKGVGVYAADGAVRAVAGSFSDPLPALVGVEQVQQGRHLLVVVPVRLSVVPADDLFDTDHNRNVRQWGRVVGHAVVELSLDALKQQKREWQIWSLATTGLALLVAGIFSSLIASSVTRPIARISRTVSQIADGRLTSRLDAGRCGALSTLAEGVNVMAEKVELTQEHLQQQIQVATEELRRQKEAAELSARIDPLTGLVNRRAFTELAEIEIRRALRYRTPLCLILVDLDHFKSINDTHGHATGDAVLASFAHTLVREVREVDVVGRLGGEEFVVLLPSVGVEEARQVAERMCQTTAAGELHVNGQPLSFTASFGVAEFDRYELTLTSWLSRADEALYRAKRQGRNRVETAG